MSPSVNGQKGHDERPRVYIVERRAEFRRLNAQLDPSAEGEQFYEPEVSYLEDAYTDENQAYGVAIQQQIAELDEQVPENVSHNGRKVAAQTVLSLKERLKRIHKEVDVATEDPEAPDNTPVVKYEVLEFPLADRVPFQESEFLKELDNPSESEVEEEEDDEEEGDEEEEEEVDDEEGLEEEEEETAEASDHIIELDDDDEDEGEEVDDDDDDDDEDGAPHTKKQRT